MSTRRRAPRRAPRASQHAVAGRYVLPGARPHEPGEPSTATTSPSAATLAGATAAARAAASPRPRREAQPPATACAREHPRRAGRAREPRRQPGRDAGRHQQGEAPVRTARGHESQDPTAPSRFKRLARGCRSDEGHGLVGGRHRDLVPRRRLRRLRRRRAWCARTRVPHERGAWGLLGARPPALRRPAASSTTSTRRRGRLPVARRRAVALAATPQPRRHGRARTRAPPARQRQPLARRPDRRLRGGRHRRGLRAPTDLRPDQRRGLGRAPPTSPTRWGTCC